MVIYQPERTSRIVTYKVEGTARGESRRRTLKAATTAYTVADTAVNVTVVGKNNEEFEDKSRKIFTDYIDQIYDRSRLWGRGPECVVLLGDLHTKISDIRYGNRSLPVRAGRFKTNPQDIESIILDNPYRKRVMEYGDHRVVMTRMPETKGVYTIGNIHKDMMMAVTDKKLITWGNLVAVRERRNPKRKRGILFLAAHGTGKTEACTTIVDRKNGMIVADDSVVIGNSGIAEGTGYKCLFSYKEPFYFEIDLLETGENPETKPQHAKYFLDKRPVPRHLRMQELLKVAIGEGPVRKIRSVSDIYSPDALPVESVVFQIPYYKYANLWFKRDVSPQEALENLEGKKEKKQYHILSPEKKKEIVSEWFSESGDIDLSRKNSLLNLKKNHSDPELYKIFGEGWMLRNAEEYCCGKFHGENSEMKERVRQMITMTENIFMVGKNTPPRPSPRLSELVAEISAG